MNTLSQLTPLFVIAQLFLIVAVAASIGIIMVASKDNVKRSGYWYVCIWITALACSSQFGNGWSDFRHYGNLPKGVYMLYIAFGVERLGVFLFYKFKWGLDWPKLMVQRANYYVAGVSALIMLAGIGYWVQQDLMSTKGQIQDFRAEVHDLDLGVSMALKDKMKSDSLQHVKDSLQHLRDAEKIAVLTSRQIQMEKSIVNMETTLSRNRFDLLRTRTEVQQLSLLCYQILREVRRDDEASPADRRGRRRTSELIDRDVLFLTPEQLTQAKKRK